MGENTTIRAPFYADCTYSYSVGKNFFANHNLNLVGIGNITIGDCIYIAPNVTLTTAEHALDPEQRAEGLEVALPIKSEITSGLVQVQLFLAELLSVIIP